MIRRQIQPVTHKSTAADGPASRLAERCCVGASLVDKPNQRLKKRLVLWPHLHARGVLGKGKRPYPARRSPQRVEHDAALIGARALQITRQLPSVIDKETEHFPAKRIVSHRLAFEVFQIDRLQGHVYLSCA